VEGTKREGGFSIASLRELNDEVDEEEGEEEDSEEAF